MMHLAQPELLLLGVLFATPYIVRRRRAWQYASLQLLPPQARLGTSAWLGAALFGSACLLLLIALANPQRTTARRTTTVQARDIVLTLDLSLSMLGYLQTATSYSAQNRLTLIQRAALKFVEQHERDRLGLLVFGDDAFGAWPLSTDAATLRARLRDLDLLLPASLRGTDVGKALAKSLDHMQERGQATSKVIILLTDGVDNIKPEAAADILQRLRDQNVELYVLGIGLADGASIAQLSRQAQGRYFDIGDAGDLDRALQAIDQLAPSPVRLIQESEPELLYRFFAFPGLLFLFLSMAYKTLWMLES